MSENETRINVNYDELHEAGSAEGLTSDQTERMWTKLRAVQPAKPARSGFSTVASYFGAALILIPMAWLMGIVTSNMGASGTLGLSLFYGACFALSAEILAKKPEQRIPAGLLYVLSATMTPFVVAAMMDMTKIDQFSTNSALIIAGATAVVGSIFTLRSRISFVALPALLAGAAVFELGAEILFKTAAFAHYEYPLLAYGAFVCVASFVVDRRSSEDYSYWGYSIGIISLFAGMFAFTQTEPGYAVFALAGLVSMFMSLVLGRHIFAIVGGAAVVWYVSHLMYTFFGNSMAFPIVLTMLGGIVIYLGVLYGRNHAKIDEVARRVVPKGIRRGLPRDDDDK